MKRTKRLCENCKEEHVFCGVFCSFCGEPDVGMLASGTPARVLLSKTASHVPVVEVGVHRPKEISP
jgi:hypothetical protein